MGIARRVDGMANVAFLEALPHDAAPAPCREPTWRSTRASPRANAHDPGGPRFGVPVVARDNAGNRQLLAAAEEGQLFRSAEELAAILEERGRAGEPARTSGRVEPGFTALLRPTLEDELAAHLELYGRLLIR